MHLPSSLLVLLATTAFSLPQSPNSQVLDQDAANCPKNCDGQKSPCTYCKSGDITMGFKSHKNNWGTILPNTMIEDLKGKCDTSLINCKTTKDGEWVNISKTGADSGSVTLKILDTSTVNKQSDLEHGIELMHAAFQHQVTSKKVHYNDGGSYPLPYYMQHGAPLTFDIQYGEGSNVDWKLVFEATISIDSDNDGTCADVLGVASAIGGSIEGTLGGVFSLATLLCD